jgi:hypothetical protein
MLCPQSHSVKLSQTGSTELLGRYGPVFQRAFGTMKWESEKILSLPIGDEKKEWILSKNLKD